jgi:hypothetical protein
MLRENIEIVVSKKRDPPSATPPRRDRVSVLTSDRGGLRCTQSSSGSRSRTSKPLE